MERETPRVKIKVKPIEHQIISNGYVDSLGQGSGHINPGFRVSAKVDGKLVYEKDVMEAYDIFAFRVRRPRFKRRVDKAKNKARNAAEKKLKNASA